jgi:hypothetical protein
MYEFDEVDIKAVGGGIFHVLIELRHGNMKRVVTFTSLKNAVRYMDAMLTQESQSRMIKCLNPEDLFIETDG